MANETTDSLYKKLDTKHPDYIEWEDEWTRYRDVLGDRLVDKERYLPRNAFEPEAQYSFRVDMSQFIPESHLAIERLIGALFNEKPKRELKGSEADLKDFLDKAARNGDSWDATMQKIAFKFLGYGTTRILVNVPPTDGLSRQEEKALGVRPWVTLYNPLSVTDWSYDENDDLSFIRIKEERVVKQDDRLKPHVREIRFIDYEKEDVSWWVFQDKKDSDGNQFTLKDQGSSRHGLGMVPMVIDQLRDVKPAVGHSFIRYSSRADIRKFQNESDLGYDTYMHAHPWLAIWTEDQLKEIGVGSQQFLKLNPGQSGGQGREDAKYITTNSTAFDSLHKAIDESRKQIFRQAQVDPMGIVASGASNDGIFQASGEARSWSFTTSEARILSRIADCLERIEVSVFEIVIRLQRAAENVSPTEVLFKGDVQYPEDYDRASTALLLEERGEIAAMVNSPTLVKILDKRIASSKVGDIPVEELRKIHQEIESRPLLGMVQTSDPFGFPEMSTGQDKKKDSSGDDGEPSNNLSARRGSPAPSR